MRLLNTESLELRFFLPSSVPDYVILSHRWNAESSEECSYEDVTKFPISDSDCPVRKKKGFSKIEGACRLAFRDHYSWIWIDSCCIDKSSSSELHEAINSMWKYYEGSNICYIYMADVQDSEAGWDQRFSKSEWFTRGWTLQELIAPLCVEFYAEDWAPIGTKSERHNEIADITKIDSAVLLQAQEVDLFSAAERLSWVAHRNVTREEDEAYSLLGLFEVNMPLLYGEGRERAFIRLQEAIYNSTADHTLFLFRHSLHAQDQPLLADSPTRFCDRLDCTLCLSDGLQTVQCLPSETRYTNIIASERWKIQAHEQIMTTVTPRRNEMSTTLPLLPYGEVFNKLTFFDNDRLLTGIIHIAVLNHTLSEKKYMRGALCLLLRRGEGPEAFHRVNRFPALLPYVGELTSRLQKTKILICPGVSSPSPDRRMDTTFCFKGDPFIVLEWSAKGSIQHSTLPVNGNATQFEVWTSESENSKRSTKVSCQIADSQNPNMKISLQLIKSNKAWSIKEVAEIKGAIRPRTQQTRFRSTHLTDRCSISFSGGENVSVGLRRSPAGCRDHSASQYKYQIVVKYL